MFEFIGALLIPIVLYYASKQFTNKLFVELFLFLAFASLVLGSFSTIIKDPPKWIIIAESVTVFLIYPSYRYYKNIKKRQMED